MKKIVACIIIFFVVFQIQIYSQYFKGGLTIGATASQIDGDKYAGYTKPGLSAGMFVERNFNDAIALHGELKYMMKGAAKIAKAEDPNKYRVTLHYLEMPFTAVYTINQKVGFELGLAGAYLIYSTINFGYGPETPDIPFNSIDLSGVGGVYYTFTERIKVNLKMQYSIIPVRDFKGETLYYRTSGQFNNLLDFGIYYSMR